MSSAQAPKNEHRAAEHAAAPVPADLVRSELGTVLASSIFGGSDRHRRFLRFVVEEALAGRASEIKESVVAIEVFGRGSSFDSHSDSVVRVEARNLRTRLHEYYDAAGNADPVIIKLPKGSYVPVFAPGAAQPTVARRRGWRLSRLMVAVAGAAIVAAGLAWWFFAGRAGSGWSGASRSIAVLPFMNLNGGTEGGYVADGFVEDLTTELATVPGLRVAARTSAFQFRGRSEDVRSIGRQLGVAAILEGSVRRQFGDVKVTAQLINCTTGYHLWSKSYERDLRDVQEVEQDIQRDVAHVLGALPPRPRASHAPSREAIEAYWRGRFLLANWQRFPESVGYFEQAVKADPRFAEAWAALAAAHAAREFQEVGSQAQESAEARVAAHTALELDETVFEAHRVLAQMDYYYDHDWRSAESEYRRALDLNPSDARTHLAFALALTSQARFAEAIAHIKLARELDPLSVLTSNTMATTLMCARRFDEALGVARRHLAMDPNNALARFAIGSLEIEKGNFAQAIGDLRKVLAQGRAVEVLGRLGNAQARAGLLTDARATVAELRGSDENRRLAGVALARVYAGMGERKQAIEWLTVASENHVTDVMFIGVDPVFDPLRTLPEFQALCARLGVPSGALR